MAVSRRGSCELGAAVWTGRFGRGTALFALMAEEVAECRKLAAVAAVFPTLRFWSTGEKANVIARFKFSCRTNVVLVMGRGLRLVDLMI